MRDFETRLRGLVFQAANEITRWFLQQAVERVEADYKPQRGEGWKGSFPLVVQGLFGTFTLWRGYYYNAKTQQGHHPGDLRLGLAGSYTPALTRLMCLAGADADSFAQAEEHLLELGGIPMAARQIHRLIQRIGAAVVTWQNRERPPEPCGAPVMYISVDGTGVPMRRPELAGRKGKQPDGTAKTRQTYLGCVFTQHGCDAKGRPLRDHNSTTYVAGFDTAEEFGLKLRREALRRGSGTAQRIVLLMDGAMGLEQLGRKNFPDHLQIVDFYHALEHAGRVLQALWGKDHPEYRKQLRRWAKLLLKDGVEKMIAQARQWAREKKRTQLVEAELGYFLNNLARMQYGTFRKQGLFIGSGVIEAGCKHIVGARCKQSGMRWSLAGATHILALRCLKSSRRLEVFWTDHWTQNSLPQITVSLAA